MATINNDFPTLLDLAKIKDPSGAIASVVESLSRRNAFLEDAVFQPGNLETGHVFGSRTALPSIGWRRFNEGVASGKTRSDQVTETCGMMAGLSKVDAALADLSGNPMAFRASEDKGFVQAFNNEAETGFIYHSTKTAPEKVMGFAPRLNATTDPGGSQIIKADAAPSGSDQTSIWLVGWGKETVFGIVPKNSSAGLKIKDLGVELVDDGTGKEFLAYRTWFELHMGLCVRDWRYIARVCNIDTSALSATGDNIVPAMIKAWHQIDNPRLARMAWYCNRTIGTYLHLQARESVKNSTLSIERIEGREVLTFLGAPVRITDGITNTEAIVS